MVSGHHSKSRIEAVSPFHFRKYYFVKAVVWGRHEGQRPVRRLLPQSKQDSLSYQRVLAVMIFGFPICSNLYKATSELGPKLLVYLIMDDELLS